MIGDLKDFRSNKFNEALRNQLFQLNRIVHEEKKAEPFLAYIVPVAFTCSKAIHITGFAAGFPFTKNDYKIQITISDDNGVLTEYNPKYSIKEIFPSTIVRFENPLFIPSHSSAEVKANLPDIETFRKYSLEKKVELDGIEFNFNVKDGDAPGVLLTRLFFY